MEKKKCVLYDRDCINCHECEFCDLDPMKICDNCGKCLDIKDYAAFKIDSIDGVPLREQPKTNNHILLKTKFTANKKLK